MRRRRMEQVDEELRKSLSEAVHELEGFPDGVLVTLTYVHTAPDFSRATVSVSVLPETLASEVLTLLERHTPRMRHEIAQQLPLRRMPDMVWVIDREMKVVDDFERALKAGT